MLKGEKVRRRKKKPSIVGTSKNESKRKVVGGNLLISVSRSCSGKKGSGMPVPMTRKKLLRSQEGTVKKNALHPANQGKAKQERPKKGKSGKRKRSNKPSESPKLNWLFGHTKR